MTARVPRSVGCVERCIAYEDVWRVSNNCVVLLPKEFIDLLQILTGEGVGQSGADVLIVSQQTLSAGQAEAGSMKRTVAYSYVDLKIGCLGELPNASDLKRCQ